MRDFRKERRKGGAQEGGQSKQEEVTHTRIEHGRHSADLRTVTTVHASKLCPTASAWTAGVQLV